MIDHLGINCTDLQRAAAFYDRVLGVLGHRRVMDVGVAIGYGTDGPDFWISTFEGVGPNREVHVAFTAPDAATVRAWRPSDAICRTRFIRSESSPSIAATSPSG